jgi:hypothetical protein
LSRLGKKKVFFGFKRSGNCPKSIRILEQFSNGNEIRLFSENSPCVFEKNSIFAAVLIIKTYGCESSRK